MNLATVKELLNTKERFASVQRRTRRNETIATYYEELADLQDNTTFINVADRMRKCCQFWDIDYYRFQGVKDTLRTNACHNRFCDHCQNVLSTQRERKFAPLLDELARTYDVYHIVFTVPNVYREELRPCLDRMYKEFAYIVRLFTGNAKIKGRDFEGYGFIGAVRAVEITKNRAENTFHPHFHTLFILRKGQKLDQNRRNINSYSFNNPDAKKSHKKQEGGAGVPQRLFSDFEVLLQKVWRLRYDGVKLTQANIKALKEGYSVICDNARGHYKEVFKYATKGVFKEGEESAVNGYHDFEALQNALYRRKLIQGYKALNGFNFETTIAQDIQADELYSRVIADLRKLEEPMRVYEYLNEIQEELKRGNVTYISRSTIAELLGRKKTPMEKGA